jgi:hypothetical protein
MQQKMGEVRMERVLSRLLSPAQIRQWTTIESRSCTIICYVAWYLMKVIMVFKTRNLYYLRIMDRTVIPLYVGALLTYKMGFNIYSFQ